MNIRNSIASLLVAAMSIACFAPTALAQMAEHRHIQSAVTIPPSSLAKPGDAGVRAHTNIRYLAIGAMTGEPQASGPPFAGYLYETPASIACIYGIRSPEAGCNPNIVSENPRGGGRAIGIVDAYDDPNVFADLQNFSTQFGLRPVTPASFQVIFAPAGGTTPGSCKAGPAARPPSAAPTGWDLEESLDVEWSHAMAPNATIYLVEAQSNHNRDLFCAVSVANALVRSAGGGEISMSWGGGEFTGETSYDPIFTVHGIVYFAAAGDGAGVIYPSASPNVVSAGGTSITTDLASGDFVSESSWQDGGGGPSAVESRPNYQNGIADIVGSQRATPDVSADANPTSGVWVLDTLVDGPGAWFVVGGTSVSAPVWAGIVNATGAFASSSQAELGRLYGGTGPISFTDITFGNCGPYVDYLAGPGWDFCTGNGSPIVSRGD